MPILRTRYAVESPTGTFIVFHALADSSDFGLGEQSSQNEIPCLGHRWTAVQNLTPLALSSAEKSVTIHIKLQQRQNSKWYIDSWHLAYRHVWIITCMLLLSGFEMFDFDSDKSCMQILSTCWLLELVDLACGRSKWRSITLEQTSLVCSWPLLTLVYVLIILWVRYSKI